MSECVVPAGLTYIPDFISEAEERVLMECVDKEEWDNSIARPVQHYGWIYDYKNRDVTKDNYLGPLPHWCETVVEKLQPHFENKIDQLIVNAYNPGQGISAHIDQPMAFGPVVASVSMLSPVPMVFQERSASDSRIERSSQERGTDRVVKIMLAPRSAVILKGDSRYKWTHSIPARAKDDGRPRHRRVSLTFRTVVQRS